MRKSIEKFILPMMLICILMVVSGVSALDVYVEDLPDDGLNYRCKYCHATRNGGGDPNQFGIDFADNNHVYDDILGGMDSDADGFTNDKEFDNDLVTNVGDANSNPDSGLEQFNLYLMIGIFVFVTILFGMVFMPRSVSVTPDDDEEEGSDDDEE